jgi:hypothetical protein
LTNESASLKSRGYGAEYRQDVALVDAMKRIIAPSYERHPAVFDHDLTVCERLYTLWDGPNLTSFFMVSFTQLEPDVPAIYLGLSATAEGRKNSGIVRRLFRQLTSDGQVFEANAGREVVMFGTLATPSSFHGVHTTWRDAQPSLDGHFAPAEAQLAHRIAAWLGAAPPSRHPFVLHGYATGTRYSAAERERIESLIKRYDFRLFERLNLDERSGDRLIITCRLPRVSIPPV